MKKTVILSVLAFSSLWSCMRVDESPNTQPTQVSFAKASATASEQTEVKLVFSKPTLSAGTITLNIEEHQVEYGTDYTLSPEKNEQSIVVPYQAGVLETTFTFHKLIDALANEEKSVVFTIQNISDNSIEKSGIVKTTLSFNQVASQGGSVMLNVGGSTQPNQVYFGLGGETQTTVRRDTWDLAFYSGNAYRVKINSSLKMAVKQLNTNDITQPVDIDNNVIVGSFDPANMAYIDHPNGQINQTAIAEISANPAENKVYLINLGAEIPETPASAGSINTAGNARGWMKIKINRAENGYQLLYAPIESTTYSEATITKNSAYNFSFYSLVNGTTAQVEPAKEAWDIVYTTFTNEIAGYGSYFYADVILINHLAGVKAYKIDQGYATFTASDIDESQFISDDQRAIGVSWRNTMPLELYANIFYVLKDAHGNYYKLKITQMQNPTTNERGFPVVEYAKLNN